MALFKVNKGLKENLPSIKTEGYCWYTTDDSLFYIDYKDQNGTLQRKALNAKDAETLMGASLSTILDSSDVEIPTSKAVLDALGEKVDKVEGKGLSTNDYTTEEKEKLAGIAEGAEVNVQADWNQNDETTADYIKNKPLIATDEDVLDLLYSQGYLIPAGANDNTIYTDNNGKLYVL